MKSQFKPIFERSADKLLVFTAQAPGLRLKYLKHLTHILLEHLKHASNGLLHVTCIKSCYMSHVLGVVTCHMYKVLLHVTCIKCCSNIQSVVSYSCHAVLTVSGSPASPSSEARGAVEAVARRGEQGELWPCSRPRSREGLRSCACSRIVLRSRTAGAWRSHCQDRTGQDRLGKTDLSSLDRSSSFNQSSWTKTALSHRLWLLKVTF